MNKITILLALLAAFAFSSPVFSEEAAPAAEEAPKAEAPALKPVVIKPVAKKEAKAVKKHKKKSIVKHTTLKAKKYTVVPVK